VEFKVGRKIGVTEIAVIVDIYDDIVAVVRHDGGWWLEEEVRWCSMRVLTYAAPTRTWLR